MLNWLAFFVFANLDKFFDGIILLHTSHFVNCFLTGTVAFFDFGKFLFDLCTLFPPLLLFHLHSILMLSFPLHSIIILLLAAFGIVMVLLLLLVIVIISL